ncbi:MAG: YqjK family protein [Pseudomonadota bacterium]
MKAILDRRAQLLARAAGERDRLADGLNRYRPLAAVGDDLIRIGRSIAAHPEWIAGAVVLLAVARPRFLLRLAGRAWVVWRALRTVRGFVQDLHR